MWQSSIGASAFAVGSAIGTAMAAVAVLSVAANKTLKATKRAINFLMLMCSIVHHLRRAIHHVISLFPEPQDFFTEIFYALGLRSLNVCSWPLVDPHAQGKSPCVTISA